MYSSGLQWSCTSGRPNLICRKNFAKKLNYSPIVNTKIQKKQVGIVAVSQSTTNTTNEISTQINQQQQSFSWTKQWYPIQVLIHLDAKRPSAIQLLGKDLVIWRDGEGKWVCFEDQCPHRLVPLSEGRIETDGTLQCAYHAWRFNAKGQCVTIPQSEPDQMQKLCSNKRACAKVHPTQEKYGLLWVWGESGTNAQLECLLKSPVVPSVLDSKYKDPNIWIVRDLPYSAETFMENVIDPAHVTVSHHGIGSFSRDEAKPIYLKLKEPLNSFNGFLMYRSDGTPFNDTDNALEKGEFIQFLPPHSVLYHQSLDHSVLLISPVTKGRCRTLQMIFEKKFSLFRLFPRWIFHMITNKFFQQDAQFLFKQENILNQKGMPCPITKAYYTPTTADFGVNQLHKWMNIHGQGGIEYSPDMVPKHLKQDDLSDVYNAHTKNCNFCLGALANFRKLQIVAWIGCAVCMTSAICCAIVEPLSSIEFFGQVFSLPSVKCLVFTLFAALFLRVGIFVNNIIPKFYRVEFSHADN